MGDERCRATGRFPPLVKHLWPCMPCTQLHAIGRSGTTTKDLNRSKGGNIRELPLTIAAPVGNECHRAIRSREPVFSLKRISKRSFLSEDSFNRLRKRIPDKRQATPAVLWFPEKRKRLGLPTAAAQMVFFFFFFFSISKQKPRSAQRGSSWAWRPGCIPPDGAFFFCFFCHVRM